MVSRCRVCDSPDLELAIDLGLQPWCNHFIRPEEAGTEPFYPLRVVHCTRCKTAQLDFTVKKEILFGDHTYLSGITRTLNDHFARVAREVDEFYMRERPAKSVLDFLYMKQIVDNLAFDQIYHEHLLYYNLETIQALLARHGLAMFDCYLSPIHGGSIIPFVTHDGKEPFSERLSTMLAAEKESAANEEETYR